MPQPTIVKDTAGQFWRVSECENPELSHVWSAAPVKKVGGEWVRRNTTHSYNIALRKDAVTVVEGDDA